MINSLRALLVRVREDERGLTAVEYAVLGAIVVGAIVAIGTPFRASLATAFTNLFTAT